MIEDDYARRIGNGTADREVWRALISYAQAQAHTRCSRLRQQDIEDIALEAAVRVNRRIGSFRGDSKFSTWVSGIVWRVVLEYLRREPPDPPISIEAIPDGLEPVAPSDVEEEYWYRIVVSNLLAPLNDSQRCVFLLRFLNGFEYREVAEVTGQSPNAVANMVNEIRTKLRRLQKTGKLEL